MKKKNHLPEVSCVYKIENLVSGSSYVGSTKNLYFRWLHHRALSTWKKYSHRQMYKDMAEIGIENFQVSILEQCDDTEMLRQREQYYIDCLEPVYNKANAYGRDAESIERMRLLKNELTRKWKKKHYEYNKQLNNNWSKRNPEKIKEYRYKQYLKRKAGKKNG